MTITKDYGNSCLNYCVLHLFQHETIAFQNRTIVLFVNVDKKSGILTTN